MFSDAVEVTKDVKKREVTVKACVPLEGEYSLTVFQLAPDTRVAVACFMLTTSDVFTDYPGKSNKLYNTTLFQRDFRYSVLLIKILKLTELISCFYNPSILIY